MKKQFKDMTPDELRKERENLVDMLDEYEDERQMMLGQTGHHISSTGLVKKYAALIEETKNSIAEIDALLG